MVIPSPFVYWAQTDKNISLKIDLKNVNKPEINVCESNIKFSTRGVGAHGDSHYEFNLDLFSPVILNKESETASVRIFDNRVEVLLQKEKPAWWPRLTAQPQKPAWLKINFDLWKSEDGHDSEEEARDVMKDYPGMYEQLQKRKLAIGKKSYGK